MNYLKENALKFFQQNKKLSHFIRKIYHYRLWKPKEIKKLGKILEQYNNYKSGNISFVQIGSNDGLNGDPIYELVKKNHWHGILIEPIPEIFEQLKDNYREYSKNLIFENIAIAGNGMGLSGFYSVRNDDGALPSWVNQLSSFEKHVIL
jgi:hypothetical protein